MTDLPPFSGHDIECPKCHGDVGMEYRPAGTAHVGPGMSRFLRGAPEWLLRSCGTCGYSWPEACADEHASTMFPAREEP